MKKKGCRLKVKRLGPEMQETSNNPRHLPGLGMGNSPSNSHIRMWKFLIVGEPFSLGWG